MQKINKGQALVTGGAGFIGTNLAVCLLGLGWRVKILDNFSRVGTEENLKFIKKSAPAGSLEVIRADICDFKKVLPCLAGVDTVFHLAAQTAVTTSITDPRLDLETNIGGTFNILEAARQQKVKPVVIYSSTNKVYGDLSWQKTPRPVDETCPLDFCAPYGCSKGAAESYVRDYWRIYGVPTVVFRQSCIYGPRQLGLEDQGWTAHLAARAILGETINIFGDGRQVRDLLYVDDLISAYLLALTNIKNISGEVFNIGGGEKNSLSVNQYLGFLTKAVAKPVQTKHFEKRAGDQHYFVSDNTKLKQVLGWLPNTSYREGLPKMIDWITQNIEIFRKI